MRWASNATVTGRIVFTDFGLAAHARLRVDRVGQTSLVRAHWQTDAKHARARVAIDGHRFTMPAP